MPVLNLANTPYSASAVSSGTAVSQDIYGGTGAGNNDSLEIINGHLNSANFTSGFAVDRTQVQRKAFSYGKSVGATANLDFFQDIFNDQATSSQFGFKFMVGIPGAGVSFYLPFTVSYLIFTWNITVANDGVTTAGDGPTLQLWYDNASVAAQRRLCPLGVFSSRQGHDQDRVWSGSHVEVNASSGWHSAGLRMIQGTDCPQTRVRVRRFSYVYLR